MCDGDVSACFDAGNSFNDKLKNALSGLSKANDARKQEIEALRLFLKHSPTNFLYFFTFKLQSKLGSYFFPKYESDH